MHSTFEIKSVIICFYEILVEFVRRQALFIIVEKPDHDVWIVGRNAFYPNSKCLGAAVARSSRLASRFTCLYFEWRLSSSALFPSLQQYLSIGATLCKHDGSSKLFYLIRKLSIAALDVSDFLLFFRNSF